MLILHFIGATFNFNQAHVQIFYVKFIYSCDYDIIILM